jgi:co-chaperonin GroES (HSP10)
MQPEYRVSDYLTSQFAWFDNIKRSDDMAHAIAMVHEENPKAAILADCEPHLGGIKVLGARVLVAVYVRPNQTKSGLFLTAKTTDEDRYQGKVGLVLAMGPIAFEDDANHRFGTVKPKAGDWVVLSVGDTFAFEMGERRMRNVEDVDVQLIIENPDAIW